MNEDAKIARRIIAWKKRSGKHNYQIAKELGISLSKFYKISRKYRISKVQYKRYFSGLNKKRLQSFVSNVWKDQPRDKKKLLRRLER